MRSFLLFVLLAVVSCTPKYDVIKGPEAANGLQLDRTGSAYISLPKDNTSKGYLYEGSGSETAGFLVMFFSKHMKNVVIGQKTETLENAIASARTLEHDYLVYPEILQWEDYVTEWNGIPDVLRLKVTVLDSETEKILDTFLIDGRGIIMSWGGDHPLDIAKKPLEQWVDSLFR